MTEDEARRQPEQVDRMTFDRLIRIADRLGQVQAGSPAADQAIHQAQWFLYNVHIPQPDASFRRITLPFPAASPAT